MKRSSFLLPLLAATTLFSTVPAARADDGPEPQLISSAAIASFRKPDGSVNSEPFGGGSNMTWLFDGDLTNGAYIGPNGRASNGSFVLVDFSRNQSMPSEGWFIVDIVISEVALYDYSLYYSMDGSSWTPVENGVAVSKQGSASYGVNDVAKYVKVVFDKVGGWNPSVSEIQIYGLDPADIGCRHPTYTEWRPIPGTATCTANGIDQRECTVCGEVFHRESETIKALGHDYQSTLLLAGSGLQYGSGTISCSRHDFEIDCTDGPVDLVPLGGVKVPGIVQFTDLSVSSTGDTGYGVREDMLIDNGWTMSWGSYWYANTTASSEYVQFEFGTAIDLASVEISVPNRTQALQFYSVVDGAEELVLEYPVESSSGAGEYQRLDIEFRGVTLQTLRIKKSGDANNKLTVCEVHPHGTVNGAGRTAAVRTRILID